MCIKLKSIPFPAFQVNSYGKQQISSKNFASATIESLTQWLLLSTASWFHWCLWFFFFLKRSYKGLVRSCQCLKSKPKKFYSFTRLEKGARGKYLKILNEVKCADLLKANWLRQGRREGGASRGPGPPSPHTF